MKSHLLQMRGLKQHEFLNNVLGYESHLLQMRGLKQQDQKYDDAQRMSHLLQMRGLKRMVVYLFFVMRSRIFYRCVD